MEVEAEVELASAAVSVTALVVLVSRWVEPQVASLMAAWARMQ